ncbi:MAG: hypothetical protein COA32_17295 [Fluviicola sp.]|nr:MAG: hypothetical protein COA32_17295 [Fluviicola sp.]
MSNLVLLNRFVLILFCFFSFFSCRKNIEHSIKKETIYTVENEVVDTLFDWIQVYNDELSFVGCLEVFNNELYVGGKGLFRISNDQQFHNGLNNQLSSFETVLAMEKYNSELIIAGTFNPIRVDIYGNSTGINFTPNDYFYEIRGIDSLSSSELLFFGVHTYATPAPGYTKRFIEITENYVAQQIPDLSYDGNFWGGVRCSLASNDLLVYADNEKLVSWDGTGWNTYNEPELEGAIASMIYYNNELFVYGSFTTGSGIKKRDAFGVWHNFHSVSTPTTSYPSGKFRIVDNELYLVSHSLYINNIESSIIKLEAGNWLRLGTFTGKVNDIIQYNGTLYLASQNGLYKYGSMHY